MPITYPLSITTTNFLLSAYGSPLQLYDERHIVDNLNNFMDIMNSNFKNFRQYFAVKALPNPNILKILIDNKSLLDCSSLTELKIAEALGLSGESIMFTSNYTSPEELLYARKMNVIINLDDISLIDDIVKIGMPELICFRLNPGIGKTNSENKSNILGGKDSKFGIPLEDIEEAYKLAKKYGTKRFGIHIMTGSNILEIDYWKELIEILFKVINNLKNNDIIIEFVNIGGGLGIPYKENDSPIDINKFVNILRTSIDEQLEKYNINEPNLYMENGRYITGPYGWLVSKCNVIKKSYNKFCGLDSCMANLMRPGMYGSYHYISILGKENNVSKEIINVVGTLCENNDWFAKDRELPIVDVGDIFIIHDTGAHSHSMGFQYNGKLRAPEILIKIDNSFQLIRRRETYEDYISTIV